MLRVVGGAVVFLATVVLCAALWTLWAIRDILMGSRHLATSNR